MSTVKSVEKKGGGGTKPALGWLAFVLLSSTRSTDRKLQGLLCVKKYLDSLLSKLFFHPTVSNIVGRESRGNPRRRSVSAAVRVWPPVFSNLFSECPDCGGTTTPPPSSSTNPFCRAGKPSLYSVSPPHTHKICFFKDTRLWPVWTARKESLWLYIARLTRPVPTKLSGTKAHRKRPYLIHRWDDLLHLFCSFWDTRKIERSCSIPASYFCFLSVFFCLNETALVVCYEKKKANNTSPNNRAELKKKILAPGCPSASGPRIRLQLAQLHSLAQAIFSGKKTWYPPPPYSTNYDCTERTTYLIFSW